MSARRYQAHSIVIALAEGFVIRHGRCKSNQKYGTNANGKEGEQFHA